MRAILMLLALSMAFALSISGAEDGSELFKAIRDGDLAVVKLHLTKSQLESRDRRGATPLMHAAAFGNLETLKLLLEAGADVNARNDFDATALLWAARDPEKARLLIERGADVTVKSKQGQTPLMAASLHRGSSLIVALMVAKGADVNVKGPRDITALGFASAVGDVESVRLLLSKGADPNSADNGGGTPIGMAAGGRQQEIVSLLIHKVVDVNASSTAAGKQVNGLTNRQNVTPLHNASAFGPVEMVRDLLNAGARVQARDSRDLTPLFFALATEYPSLETVGTLLRSGAEVNARDNTGETPLDWAQKFGHPQILAELQKAGAKNGIAYQPPNRPAVAALKPAEALMRSVKLLESTSAEFFKKSACVSCHHQPLIARTQIFAKSAGIAINESVATEQSRQMSSQWSGLQEDFLQGLTPGGGPNRLAEMLLGLKAAGYPADTLTDSAVVVVADSQEPDGRWRAVEVQLRPPITESDVAATARTIQALQGYSIPARRQEFAKRIARGLAWLKQTKPVRAEDSSMRLSGLTWGGASEGDLKSAANGLLSLQRPDGGWGNNPYMDSDAYATGGALVALAESGVVNVNGSAYQRGVKYLLSTQFPDGSWHVRSRAIKFQPYFESGFPFGHDQWISTAATAWASQAIALSIQPPVAVGRRN